MKGGRYRDLALFMIMSLTWGLNWPIMKLGLRYARPLRFTADRLALAAPIIMVYYLLSNRRVYNLKSSIGSLITYSLIVSIQFALSSIGLYYQSGGLSSIITYTQPMMVFILAILFLNEKLLLSRLIGTLIGFLGVAILLGGGGSSILSYTSLLLLLLGAFLWATSTIYYKLKLKLLDPLIVNIIQVSTSSIVLYTVSLPVESPPVSSIEYLAILIYSGPIAVGIGATIWLKLLGRIDASILSSSSLIVPLIAVVSGYLILGEEVGLRTILGSALILIGVYLVNYDHRSRMESRILRSIVGVVYRSVRIGS
ncbi:MAG: DMT family transporter [Candidatus Bathyarchaeia archaeon]|nr:DMT family transporter [Candidatus Jordarchaeia archaeon]